MAHLIFGKQFERGGSGSRLVGICLGVAATLTSLFITVIAGEERGVTLAEKAVWIATGVVILLGAHLLPALVSGARVFVKGIVLPIWIGALLAAGYTHATFFLNAQGRVGEQRAATIAAATPVPALPAAAGLRSRTQIAADVAATSRNLALLDNRRCNADCVPVAARRKVLSARMEALRIEDAEAVRAEKVSDARMAAVDRGQKAQDDARVDPFVAGLATFLRLGADQISLIVAIVLGWLVDAVAIVAWASVARAQPRPVMSELVPQAHVAARVPGPGGMFATQTVVLRAAANEPLLHGEFVAPAIPEVAGSSAPIAAEISAIEESDQVTDLADLASAIRAGRAKTTLISIRAYLGCTDSAAMALRRRLAEEHPDLFRPVPRVG